MKKRGFTEAILSYFRPLKVDVSMSNPFKECFGTYRISLKYLSSF